MTSLSSIVHLDIVVVVSYTLDLGPNHVPIITFDPIINLSLFLVILAVMVFYDFGEIGTQVSSILFLATPLCLNICTLCLTPFKV